jgi:hypothetical protein
MTQEDEDITRARKKLHDLLVQVDAAGDAGGDPSDSTWRDLDEATKDLALAQERAQTPKITPIK